ncbi:ATP binding protein [Aureococcus anophagefferens]|nr:ATP binding protein [Aureococcus anophagefferens]
MESTSSGRAGDDADDGAAPGSGRRTDGAEPGDGEAPTRAPSPSPSPGTETATKRPRGDEAPAEGRQKRRASPQASRGGRARCSRAARGRETPASRDRIPRDRIPRVPGRATAGPRDRMHEGAVGEALASDAYAALVRRRLVGLHVAAGCAVADAPAADAPAAGRRRRRRRRRRRGAAAAVVATAPGGVVRVSARTRVGVTLALRSAARDPAGPAPASNCYPSRRPLTAVRELVAVPWLADLASDPERREIPEGALIHGPAGAGKTFACAAAAAPAAGPAFGAGNTSARAFELGCAGLLERDVGAALRALDGAFAGAAAFAAGRAPRRGAAAGAFYGVGLVVLDGVDAWGAKDGRRDAPALAAKKAVLCSRLRELARARARAARRRALGPKTAGHVVVCGTSRLPPGDLDGAVPPSGLAAFAVEVPKTSWAGVGARPRRRALQQAVIWPVTRRAEFDRFGIRACRGVLLHGPPGCSKTLLARATASESSCAFIALSGADVYSPYLGEAEATVRRAFAAADAATPCILFFDEIDALVCDRAGGDGRGAEARVLSTFLNCLDGASGGPRDGVVTLGATNRPHAIDRALLRPGRLETSVYVGLPGLADREAVLASTRGLPSRPASTSPRSRRGRGASPARTSARSARTARGTRSGSGPTSPRARAAATAPPGGGRAAGAGRGGAPGPPLSVAFADLVAAADAIVPSNDRSRTSPHAFERLRASTRAGGEPAGAGGASASASASSSSANSSS